MKQSIYFRIQLSDKMEDVSCTTENRCRKSSSREFRSDRDSTVKLAQEAMRSNIGRTTR